MINKTKVDFNSIPVETEIFGRKIKTLYDETHLDSRGALGEARYGSNEIILTSRIFRDKKIDPDEIKLTYIHELLHFILSFSGYQDIIKDSNVINLEQFIEILSAGIYEGVLKRAKY